MVVVDVWLNGSIDRLVSLSKLKISALYLSIYLSIYRDKNPLRAEHKGRYQRRCYTFEREHKDTNSP